jgi:uncharacterized protein (TIGR03086 family)
MADLLELHRRGAERFSDLVDEVGPRWSDRTPDTEWDVRALVNHLTAEQLWAPPLMGGATVAEVGDRFDGDVLGDDPTSTWHRSIAAASAAFGEPGALERTVHLSFGDVPGEEYVFQMTMDLHLHAWDLATALGADDTIDADSVSMLLPRLAPMVEVLAGSGMFAPPVPVEDDADEQTRLLAVLGRRPGGGLAS